MTSIVLNMKNNSMVMYKVGNCMLSLRQVMKIGFKCQQRFSSSYQQIKANKTGLSWELDSTMRDGHHDMITFGLGFARSVSSIKQQAHTMASLAAPYAVLENAFDDTPMTSRAGKFWHVLGADVRKADALMSDVQNLYGGNSLPTPAAGRYVASIQNASREMIEGEPESKGDLLLAHAYVRYLADLFGGSFLGHPTRLALALKDVPEFYRPSQGPHAELIKADRAVFIERFYQQLNDAGKGMSVERQAQVVEEARRAFKHNADIYTEQPGFLIGAAAGSLKLAFGYLRAAMHDVTPSQIKSS